MAEYHKVEWQVRIVAGLLLLFGVAVFVAFFLWGVPLLGRTANQITTAAFWDGAYWVLLIALVLWVIWQNYATARALNEWATIKDNQYNSLKEDLRNLKDKVEFLSKKPA